MRTAAKAATQHSKKAGQDACKFARKAGVSESVAEKERDEAEREAERLEEQAEQAADKTVQAPVSVVTMQGLPDPKPNDANLPVDLNRTSLFWGLLCILINSVLWSSY